MINITKQYNPEQPRDGLGRWTSAIGRVLGRAADTYFNAVDEKDPRPPQARLDNPGLVKPKKNIFSRVADSYFRALDGEDL